MYVILTNLFDLPNGHGTPPLVDTANDEPIRQAYENLNPASTTSSLQRIDRASQEEEQQQITLGEDQQNDETKQFAH